MSGTGPRQRVTSACMHVRAMMGYMERRQTRMQRETNAATVLLQGRVAPEARAAVQAAAAKSGVSVAYYLEKFILEVDRNGGLPLVAHPRLQKETLPIAV